LLWLLVLALWLLAALVFSHPAQKQRFGLTDVDPPASPRLP
jgi:hypothetical protein